jgi:superkiller protein 3
MKQPQKDISGAESCIKELFRIAPNSPRAYSALGHFLKANKDYDAAIENFRKAVEVDPYYFRAIRALSLMYVQ